EANGRIPLAACRLACPAEAIVLAALSDPERRDPKLKAQERNYTVLDFLLTKPRVTYLARVRNPNPAMPDYQASPLSFDEFSRKNGNTFEQHEGGNGAGYDEQYPPAKGAGKGAHLWRTFR